MDNPETVERIAKSLPVKDLQTCQSNGVYFAYGRGPDDKGKTCWHGVWFTEFMGGVGQTLEFNGNASEKSVQNALYKHGIMSLS